MIPRKFHIFSFTYHRKYHNSMSDIASKPPSTPDLEPDNSGSDSEQGYESDEYAHLDLADALKQEIEDGVYTCLICTGEIDSHSKIWSCDVCYRVYDLDCVKGWSDRALKKEKSQTWKCPSCNTEKFEPVTTYKCWCGKMTDPPYNGLVPHSCGQTCSVKLGCVHGCSLMCHPGPHADCTAIGPALKCDCGNHKKQLPCIISPYDGWNCGDTCGEMLPCGDHKCKKNCHGGLCGGCPELVSSTCFCGKVTKDIACSDRHGAWSEVKEAETSNTKKSKWIGYFSCESICDETFDCGVHKCDMLCHSRQTDDHKCPKSPIANEKCPCGNTLVKEVLGHERTSCEEEIPVCSKPCRKTMKCGHECMSYCHNGECPPCRRILPVKCACGSQLYDSPCAFIQSQNKPRCKKRCTAMMHCRRHRCDQICCEYESKALERERARKKKLRGNSTASSIDDQNIEQVHQCQEVCNKVLNCGKHRCIMTCHTGSCRPCIESSPNDYHCPCGMTVIQAPIRCGSMIPKCKHPCTRPPPCGKHPPVEHTCHGDDEECPKCPYTVEKRCVCERNVVKGVQCYREEVSCGKMCGELLECGHKCQKVCHKQGYCETKCQSACGAELPCGHRHKARCHYDDPCGEVKPGCNEMVTLKCNCGNLSRVEKCKQIPIGKLECDDSCAIAERNRKLAEALNIDVDANKTHEYNPDLLDIYHSEPQWGDGIEEQLIQFVNDYKKEGSSAKKVLKFPAMRSKRRMFIHILCEEFKLTSMAQDPEPNRSVVVSGPEKAEIPAARLKKYYNPW